MFYINIDSNDHVMWKILLIVTNPQRIITQLLRSSQLSPSLNLLYGVFN